MHEAVDAQLLRVAERADANRRNGAYRRRILTELGDIELSVSRTRTYCFVCARIVFVPSNFYLNILTFPAPFAISASRWMTPSRSPKRPITKCRGNSRVSGRGRR